MKLGDMYEQWQKKTNRSIGRVGVFDDVTEVEESAPFAGNAAARRQGQRGGDQTKSVVQIRKEREAKQDTRMKNMKKSDRKRLERKEQSGGNKEKDGNKEKGATAKGYQGKKGKSGRWAGKGKRG